MTEQERWLRESHLERYLNNWERLFVKHTDGLIAKTTLPGWDQAGRNWLRFHMTREICESFKGAGYRADFEAHTDAMLAEIQDEASRVGLQCVAGKGRKLLFQEG